MARGRKLGRVGSIAGRRFTPANAKNLVGVAKVLGPVVLPVVAPYVLRAASAAREGIDRYRAHRLGIAVDELGTYSGRGGALHARLVGADQALAELAENGDVTDADRRWADGERDTLAKLAAAVRAAERMPIARRRAAHRAISAEVDPIEQELLRRLGV